MSIKAIATMDGYKLTMYIKATATMVMMSVKVMVTSFDSMEIKVMMTFKT